MVTIREIAEAVGVSRGTVDRVLHRRGHVDAKIEEKVWEVAKQQGYVPNRAGRALAVRKIGKKIGVILIAENNPFFLPLLEGMKEGQQEYEDYAISLDIRYIQKHSVEDQIQLIDTLISEKIDALILIPINEPAVSRKLSDLRKMDIPVITLNSDINDSNRVCFVGSDYTQSGRVAGHLMNMVAPDEKEVCIVIGSHNAICHKERLRGFEELYGNKDLLPKFTVIECEDDDETAFNAIEQLLKNQPEINAFYFAAGGVKGGLEALKRAQLSKSPIIIAMDETDAVLNAIKEDFVIATISQEPHRQGYEAVRVVCNTILSRDLSPIPDIIMNSNIIMKYNLPNQSITNTQEVRHEKNDA